MKTFEEFKAKYPKLYSTLGYFECSNGWYPLIDKLSERLEEVNNSLTDGHIHAAQVKNKFGGLRFYIDTENVCAADYDMIQAFIAEAESLSYMTCELCSDAIDKKNVTRYQSICQKCFNKAK